MTSFGKHKPNYLLRKLRIWRRAPVFFAGKAWDKVFGSDDSWIARPRKDFHAGSWEWLALTENHYGGFKVGIASNNNRGGDRMSPFFHRYGLTYQEFLRPLLPKREESLTLVEVGILNGSGLAIWCDLFPNARVIGFDIDLRNFEANRAALEAAGAFSFNRPELYEFDQLDLGKAARILKDVLGGTKVDVAIDDGCHTIESIKKTYDALMPYMAKRFVYFIEDNFETYDVLAKHNRHLRWAQRGEITVAARGQRR